MALKRGVLAKVDRRLLSELDPQEGVQLVKVPVSDAVWSTWRRLCQAVGISMGQGLAILLERELASLADEDLTGLAERLEKREADLASREAEVAQRERDLAGREAEVRVREAEVTRASDPAAATPKRGRNEPCWCGSGKKFKYCHGRTWNVS